MTKMKGTTGGQTIKIHYQQEYDLLVRIHSNTLTLEELAGFDTKILWKLKQKAHNFQLKRIPDLSQEGWPKGDMLYIKIFDPTIDFVIVDYKLFVPDWHKEQLLAHFHGTPGKDVDNPTKAHYGRMKMHQIISDRHYGVTQKDCQAFVSFCPICRAFPLNNGGAWIR